MPDRPAPIDDVREISRLAYGFMGSKALFAALELDLFTRLAAGAKTADDLADETGIVRHRLVTLLTACVSLGLLSKSGDRYANAPAAQTYLSRSSPRYFADYYRFQIDRQIYPAFEHLSGALRGERRDLYHVTQDAHEADYFIRAQHSGSLGPAVVLSRQVDLSTHRKLLDVAGGSGAFSITLCQRFPDLTATILDFPAVRPRAERFVAEAGLTDRIRFLPGDAFAVDWPAGNDVVLISYLLSAVGAQAIPELLRRAFGALRPGGLLLLHDFMVGDDATGPTSAALWLLFSLLCDPDAAMLTPQLVSTQVSAAGFTDVKSRETIPTITRMVSATKPGAT
jgi:ubiquinone/menaquinone biosynthesis C-methylase UbiE